MATMTPTEEPKYDADALLHDPPTQAELDAEIARLMSFGLSRAEATNQAPRNIPRRREILREGR